MPDKSLRWRDINIQSVTNLRTIYADKYKFTAFNTPSNYVYVTIIFPHVLVFTLLIIAKLGFLKCSVLNISLIRILKHKT